MKRRRVKSKTKKQPTSSINKSKNSTFDNEKDEVKNKSNKSAEERNDIYKKINKNITVKDNTSTLDKSNVETKEDILIIDKTDRYSNSDDTNSSSSISNDKNNKQHLFIELKLISIDAKCVGYKQLEQRFLCINSNKSSLCSHIQKFIVNKMRIQDDTFEIVLIYNGFEIDSKCPLDYLKNRFFKDKDLMTLYYAIIERKVQLPSSSFSLANTPSSTPISTTSSKTNSIEMDTD